MPHSFYRKEKVFCSIVVVYCFKTDENNLNAGLIIFVLAVIFSVIDENILNAEDIFSTVDEIFPNAGVIFFAVDENNLKAGAFCSNVGVICSAINENILNVRVIFSKAKPKFNSVACPDVDCLKSR